MKKYKIFGVVMVLALFFSACEDTNENLVGSRGVAITPVVSDIYPSSQQFSDVSEDSYVSFTVSLLDGDECDAAEIQVEYDDNTATVQEISSFPVDITITATEMLTALDITESDVSLGTSFTLYVITTNDGVSTRSLANVSIALPCEFDADLTTGSYSVVSDGWGVDSDVTITADPDDPYTLYIEGLAEADGLVSNGNTMKIMISESFGIYGDDEGTVLAENCGGWGSDYESYTNMTYTVSEGSYSSCDGTMTISFTLSIDQGSWGDYEFVFTQE